MRALWIVTLAVGVGCVVLLLQLRADEPRAAARAATPMALLRADGEPPAARPSATAAAPSAAGPAPPGLAALADDQPPRTEEEQTAQRAQRRREREELRVRIHAAMEREPRDARWAAQLETELRGSVEQSARVARLESVDCRSSLCEVVLTHPHVDAQTEAMTALAGAPGFRLAGTAHLERDTGGRLTTYVFLARGRDRFPRL
jgi:hypothetical protein